MYFAITVLPLATTTPNPICNRAAVFFDGRITIKVRDYFSVFAIVTLRHTDTGERRSMSGLRLGFRVGENLPIPRGCSHSHIRLSPPLPHYKFKLSHLKLSRPKFLSLRASSKLCPVRTGRTLRCSLSGCSWYKTIK